MNPYRLPLFLAIPPAAALVFLMPVRTPDSAPGVTFALPRAVAVAAPLPIPDECTLFGRDAPAKTAVAIATGKPADAAPQAPVYRLSAFAGGGSDWVVSVEIAPGRYATLRRGERIPGTGLEFRDMEFSFSPGGTPESRAVFFDTASSRRVDLTAFAGPDK